MAASGNRAAHGKKCTGKVSAALSPNGRLGETQPLSLGPVFSSVSCSEPEWPPRAWHSGSNCGRNSVSAALSPNGRLGMIRKPGKSWLKESSVSCSEPEWPPRGCAGDNRNPGPSGVSAALSPNGRLGNDCQDPSDGQDGVSAALSPNGRLGPADQVDNALHVANVSAALSPNGRLGKPPAEGTEALYRCQLL